LTRRHLIVGALALAAPFPLLLGGCASLYNHDVKLPPTSVQALEYYPREVKGYENTYPQRRILVLAATDERDFKDPTAYNHSPDPAGNPAIGVVIDRDDLIIQRIYGQALSALVQKAFVASAVEAGFSAAPSDESLEAALRRTNFDYVLVPKIARCWVKKRRGPDARSGPTWLMSADFGVQVAIYKPPFTTPFWQGAIGAPYDDPPMGGSLLGGPDDDTSVFDEPGQVLSVALTRAIAGVFRRSDLHELVEQDAIIRAR
jgi:hypothetical protein